MVTVLMATYQGKKYLEQQLDSILAQTVPVRIFVSDDGSDDGTREMLGQYREWYPNQVFLMHRGEGRPRNGAVPPAARNFFWLMACAAWEGKSDYIMLSDQDDVWHNDKVRRLLGRMKRLETELGKDHPILVHSDMEVVDRALNQIHSSFFAYQHCDPERTSFAEVLVENPVTGGALMMNRALLKLVAGDRAAAEPETAGLRAAEPETMGQRDAEPERTWDRTLPASCYMHDWWIALAASCFGTIDCVRAPLYQYRQHGANTLGARETGSIKDMGQRLGRRQQVKENYSRMFKQAVAFGRRYGRYMDGEQKEILRAFLALPRQSPSERFENIREHHMYKSTLSQILGMCVTVPRVKTISERMQMPGVGERRAAENRAPKSRRKTGV